MALAAPCDIKPGTPDIVRHDLSASYCELCSYGYITIVVSNPYEGADMTNMMVVENLGASGLTYTDVSGLSSVTYSVNGGPQQAGGRPAVAGNELTWTSAEIAPLDDLDFDADLFDVATLTITFAVARSGGVSDQEELVNAPRDIQARLTYTAEYVDDPPGPPPPVTYQCAGTPTTVSTGFDLLPLREPVPNVFKAGRNVDASQTGYADTVYGNNNDDVIWRVTVTNSGQAGLEDLIFSDDMQTGSLDMAWICPTEAMAEQVANSNGTSVPAACDAINNNLNNYDVDDPFGNPANDESQPLASFVDVPASGTTEFFLVGKVRATGACVDDRINTADTIGWGCEGDGGAGGIGTTSTGSGSHTPAPDTADLSTRRDSDLDFAVSITGVGGNPRAGSKGRVRITITNNTGGTVKNIQLHDVLPIEYVVDPTFDPTVDTTPAYGDYDGMIDEINWTNYVAGTYPAQTSSNPGDYLANTQPRFTLTSSTENESYPPPADQANMLRHGDVAVVTFGIVLIRPQSFDRAADLDVRQEDPASVPANTDPDNAITLDNQLNVIYEDFCNPGAAINDTFDTQHASDPEDLDIDIIGAELVFILTNDPAQALPLTVRLTNRGGHSAADYVAYASFGQTMEVIAPFPAGCSEITNPANLPGLAVWQDPAPIPGGATVFACTGGDIAANGSTDYDFQVIKSSDGGDIAADDLSFRADVIGQITLDDGTPLWFPAVVNPRPGDSGADDYNNYSLDGIRARMVGFNLTKTQEGNCTENNPPPILSGGPLNNVPPDLDLHVQIGEECKFRIESGGWFGFQTPGFNFIAVQNIEVFDRLPDGQGYVSSTGRNDPPLNTAGIIDPVLTSPGVIAEGDAEWSFNEDDLERINTIDEWFRVDITSRLLNDPVDTSAAPNRHALQSTNFLESYFDAIFQTAPADPIVPIRLGPGTVGYPRMDVRHIPLTVTEPNLTVVKEVCNETLSATGNGPNCTPFVDLADNGDAYDDYVYRLTISNQAAADGEPRAPAYDVTVTDTLDASDLAYVQPFATDGLDNDGDGASDGGDGAEGDISDNTVRNGTPAVLTFDYSDSAALTRIDPGASVQLYYRVDFDDDAAPLQTFTNTADATYDSLAGASGGQTVDLRPNSDIGGARAYTSPADTASVRVIPVLTDPKRIAALSNTPPAVAPAVQGVSVGEEIEYRLNTLLPVALLRNFVIRDELPAGLRCSQAPDVDLGAPPYDAANFIPGGSFTPQCEDGFVQWDFGDQRVTNGNVGNRFAFEIGFIARVENTAGTNDGDTLSNGDPATSVTARYRDESNTLVTIDFGQVDVVVQEPRIALTKAFAVASADADDILTVTVTAANTGTATAYNLRVLDDLTGRNLTFVGNVGGSHPPDNIDTATFGANQPLFSWNAPNGIDAGDTISFTFEVSVDAVVQPDELLDNTIQADWTSLPGQTIALNSGGTIGADGSDTGMRIGALPNAGHAVNDYETDASHDTVVPAVTLTKTDLDPALVPAIGERKRFQIDIGLPEGITNDLIVTDSLDAAGISYLLENNAGFDITYTFQGIATINGAAPDESNFNAFPADATTGNAVWDIGTVVTQTENDTAQNVVTPLIRILYTARINNDLVTDGGDALQNDAVATYTHGESGNPATVADDTPQVDVVEPVLAAAKTMTNVTPGKQPGDPAGGGDTLQYVVAVLNNGTSTAHDINLFDTLPSGLALDATFTPTATINGTPVAGFVPTPANAPNGPLVWGRGNGDDSLDLPVGQSLELTYRVVVNELSGGFSNSVWVDWTSLDGTSSVERTGDGCPTWTAPNDYCTGPATVTTTTTDNNAISKTVTADTFDAPPLSTAVDAIARVGDTITYSLAVTLRGGLTRNVQVQDVLPGGMALVDTVSINGDTTLDYAPPANGAGSNFAYVPITAANVPTAGQTGTLTWTIGDVVNDPTGDPTTDTLVILYRAQILPDSGIAHVNTAVLTNSATLTYEGAPALTSNAPVTLNQPVIAHVTKTDRSGRTSPAQVDVTTDVMQFRLETCNTGAAPAYSMELTDQLASQLDETSIANLVVAVDGTVLTAGVDYTYTPPAGRGGTLHFLLNTPVDPGQCLTVDYDIGMHTDFGPNQIWSNSVTVDAYWSLPGQSGQQYGPVGPATFNMTNTVGTIEPPVKTVVSPVSRRVAIGETVVYRITVPAAPVNAALNDVRIIDDLSASAADLTFVSVAKVSGSQPWTPVNTGTPTSLVIEDPAIGIDIPAGEQIEIDITVMVADTATNVSGLDFINIAAYTFNQINGDPGTQADGGSDDSEIVTVVGPAELFLTKTGPPDMQVGTPATFTLDIHNPSHPDAGTAWNLTILDRLPDGPTGGTCGAGPTNVSAEIVDGGTSTPLVQNTDFAVSFTGAPDCEWSLTLLSPSGGLAPDQYLRVTYEVELDADTENAVNLTNIAGVTQWFSTDPGVPGATPHTFSRELTDGTPGTLDHEDAHTIGAEAPVLTFTKTVRNVTTGQDPGTDASPGDTLHYTIRLENGGPVGMTGFSIVDELDGLNIVPVFVAGSLNLLVVPAGADISGTDALGGTHGTGLVSIANLNIDAQGGADTVVTLEFEITLAPAIDSGTVALNQAQLISERPDPLLSDEPNLGGDTDPTETLIDSAPTFEVLKTAAIMSGDPELLMAGEILRYTLTIRNIGDENAINVSLRDLTPANTTYVANSTTLNGVAVPDATPGVSPLETGILINASEDTTPGNMRADADPEATNVATVTFDIQVDADAMDGLVIENQGFVGGDGAGSGTQPEQPSDDPDTPVPDDPTRTVVGNQPLLYAHKTVQLHEDLGSPDIVDPGDALRYTIEVRNDGPIPATNVVLTDVVPANTTYVAESLRLNGVYLGLDNGVFPLTAGLLVQSGDNPGDGIITAGESAVVTFEARVDAGTPTGTVISNQGSVTSEELPPELTDSDGLPSNGDQPTEIVVGDAQLVTITTEVTAVGGAALPGGELEYTIRVTNNGTLPATQVVISDDLNPPLGDQVTYVAGSGTLDGAAGGVSYSGGVLTADFAAQYGDLAPGASAVVRFRVQIDAGLAMGTTITNTGVVQWNNPAQTASSSVSIDVGGTPGSAIINGNAWHDADLDRLRDTAELRLEGWSVALYRNAQLVATTFTDADGVYAFGGLAPNLGTPDRYELRFTARGAGPDAAALGWADSVFTNAPHRISDIVAGSGANLQDLNLPITPNGAVYNSVVREVIPGATLALFNAATGAELPVQCFDDPQQQHQVTAQDGFYKFDLNFSDGACPAGETYLIEVTPPASGYVAGPSRIIPPSSDTGMAAFSVPACLGSPVDAVPATADCCEAVASPVIPPLSVPPRTAETTYYLHLLLENGSVPAQSQIFNNPIPLDPEMEGAVAITKTAGQVNVNRATLVPYTITVTNVLGVPLFDVNIVDRFPAGFKYVAGSARLNGVAAEPDVEGRQLTWGGLVLEVTEKYTIELLLVVGSGVSEGEYVNRAQVMNSATGEAISGEATATVRVVPDPDFDCTDIIGKVFDDRNLNGRQDEGEKGLAGVRVVTVRGLIATTDTYGRFHITCAAVPDEDRGSNFILKVDERSLPSGYRLTTENPRVQRATRGKMLRFNFGATIHRVVRLDIADGVFESDTSDLRLQWEPRIAQLVEELKKAPSTLRLSYLADVEPKSLVRRRLDALKRLIADQWKQADGGYPLAIETEVFWRRGAPFTGRR